MGWLDGLDGLFLDFYGTVAGGDRAAVERVCARVVADLGLQPLTPQQLAHDWGHAFFAVIERANAADFLTLAECERVSLRQTLARMGVTADVEPYVAALIEYWRAPPLFDDAAQTLMALNLPVCCVSNIDTADLDAACRLHNLRFSHVVTSESARSYKPHGDIFRRALQQTGWDPARVVHVGDSLHSDVSGAQRAGLRAVWLERENRILDIGRAAPHGRIASLRELLD